MPALARAGSRHRQPFDPITAVLFKIIQAITFLFVLAVLFMNPVSKQGIIDPKAEYIITVAWPDKNPNDIDTYVEDPAGNLIDFASPAAGLIHLDRDDRGNLLGRFTPEFCDEPRPFREPPSLSEEEWQRIESQPSYAPEQVLAHLEKL